ncbi:MAG TPA: gluconeogenesis factor YvcK family protein [Vicinamibacterales bacterium]|nr:gluconeogenesis factor YvcK family protein [Vicinamibacterales bacterium]
MSTVASATGGRSLRLPKPPGGLRVVALGGGTGLPNVLRGLSALLQVGRPIGGHAITRRSLVAIVATSDDGGSSGRLRRELGVMPPGDIRNCLAALAEEHGLLTELLQFRFERGDGLAGHALGNLVLAALAQVTHDMTRAIEIAGRALGARGIVLPATTEQATLAAELDDGRVVHGEQAIVSSGRRIRRVRLLPETARPVPAALEALARADTIVVGPGSLFTSLLPVLLAPGVPEALRHAPAVKIFVLNLMTEPGETDGFEALEHLRVIEAHLGFQPFDWVLYNTAPLPAELVAAYAAQGARPVAVTRADVEALGASGARAWGAPLAAEGAPGRIRHHPGRVAAGIIACALQGRREAGGIALPER